MLMNNLDPESPRTRTTSSAIRLSRPARPGAGLPSNAIVRDCAARRRRYASHPSGKPVVGSERTNGAAVLIATRTWSGMGHLGALPELEQAGPDDVGNTAGSWIYLGPSHPAGQYNFAEGPAHISTARSEDRDPDRGLGGWCRAAPGRHVERRRLRVLEVDEARSRRRRTSFYVDRLTPIRPSLAWAGRPRPVLVRQHIRAVRQLRGDRTRLGESGKLFDLVH